MDLLEGAIRPYAWGSRTFIAELLGKPVPAPHPEAELWLGAHPADSGTVNGTPLTELLAADPSTHLGEVAARRWSGRLPFLLKVLAADEPLSLQAHPTVEQAREGHAREEAKGIARDAPDRNYPDPTAKPELLCALSEFHALAGFRAPQRSIELLRALESAPLRPYTELLAGQPDGDGLRALFTTLVTLPSAALDKLFPAVVESCVEHVRGRGAFDIECRTILELAESYPGDPGVLAAILLNRIVLEPGEAIHLPAGNLHAYLRGSAVEILANSDNVLRCGLTPKHVDVPELLRVLDFTAWDMPVFKGEASEQNLRVYRTPAIEFELSVVEFEPTSQRTSVLLASTGPQILLCVAGTADCHTEKGKRPISRGEALWLSAGDGPVTVSRTGDQPIRIYRATLPSHITE